MAPYGRLLLAGAGLIWAGMPRRAIHAACGLTAVSSREPRASAAVFHLGDRSLASGSDRAIWQHARDHGLIIVTTDEDFQRLSVLYGPPPKVIWIRFGNCSTADIVRLLSERRNEIDRFSADEDAAFLALA
jgi:predicted nuclease of predicted toxin-antitoxin system